MHLYDVLLVLAMAAFHHGTPPVRRRPWLLALPIGILLVPVPLFAIQANNPTSRMLDWAGLSCIVLTAAIMVYLAAECSAGHFVLGHGRWRSPRSPRSRSPCGS